MNTQWTESVIQTYINTETQESLFLEYKAADALAKSDGKKNEITKDISAMANSAGGIIIYGIKEYDDKSKRHLPEAIDPVDQTIFPKEWLEQIIANIKPRISGIKIHPVTIGNNINSVVYVVEIPQGETAHQANDLKYYRRYNFQSIAMEDHEIRDVMGRAQYPKIELSFTIQTHLREYALTYDQITGMPIQTSQGIYTILQVTAKNVGRVYAQYVNGFIRIPCNLIDEDPYEHLERITIDGHEYVDYYKDNTTRDIIGYIDKGFNTPGTPKYSTPRYDPMLPNTSRVWEFTLTTDLGRIDLSNSFILWELYADNAPVNTGSIRVDRIKHIGRL